MPTVPQALAASTCRDVPVGGRFGVTVSGRSMVPTLLPGDELAVERITDVAGLRLGDVVVVDFADVGLAVHRLLWRGRRGVRTRGDGTGRMDAPIATSDVLGRVVSARRDGVEVLPGGLRARLAWVRQFSAAAVYRIGRRLAPLASAGARPHEGSIACRK